MADSAVGFHFEVPTRTVESCVEAELVLALRAGAEEAYEELIDLYQHPVYNLVCRLLNDTGEASDVVQEVFLKVFRNIGGFRSNSSLKTWIYRIAVNEAYNHRRWFSRHQTRTLAGGPGDKEQPRDTFADPGPSPFDVTSDREVRALIESALAELNPKFRTVVVLRDVEGLSYEEIAAVLDLSMGTVKSRMVRGRDALRTIVASRCGPQPVLCFSPQNG